MNDPLNLNTHGKTIGTGQAVFMGCSFTTGVGVDPDQRYSSLMAKHWGVQEVNLGTLILNNYKSFDVFSQLKFSSSGNPVVLQLTELSRIQTYQSQAPSIRFLSNQPSRSYLEVYNDQFLIFELVKNLRWFVAMCRMQRLNLVMWSIARLEHSLHMMLEQYLGQYQEYVFLSSILGDPESYRVDNGSDGTDQLGTGHPGPLSHQRIAEKLLHHYHKLYQ
jgi:hypothetical protein